MYHIKVTSEHPKGEGFCIAVKKSGSVCLFSNLGTVKSRRDQLSAEGRLLCGMHLRSNELAVLGRGHLMVKRDVNRDEVGLNSIFSAVYRHNTKTGEDKVYLAGILTPEIIARMLLEMFRLAGIEYDDVRIVRLGPINPHLLIDGNVMYLRKGR